MNTARKTSTESNHWMSLLPLYKFISLHPSYSFSLCFLLPLAIHFMSQHAIFCYYFKKKSLCSQDGAQFVDRFFYYFFTIFVPFRCFVCDNVLSY